MSCLKEAHALYTQAQVVRAQELAGTNGSVYSLLLRTVGEEKPLPSAAGQFFMLRSCKTDTLLCRPISVYRSTGTTLEFLILKKGRGTEALCKIEENLLVDVLGPLGNSFPWPKSDDKVCIIGGGIGIAPVAGFASSLAPQSYDFIASFKSGSYGLEHIEPQTLTVTTDDGSVGIHGMLPAAFSADIIRQKGYTAVYACGPVPMLQYIQKECIAAGATSWLSMESRMACGLGACLGCSIPTTQGRRRCCKDGPVFEGATLIFEKPAAPRIACNAPLAEEPDLSVEIAGVRFANPVIAASGTFGYGTEYADVLAVNRLGGICSKGLTLEARSGNGGLRLHETPAGLINSIGLENPGIRHFIDHEMRAMLGLRPVAIANLSGSSIETYVSGAELLDKTPVPMIELNISCPNVKAGGMAFGLDAQTAALVVAEVRKATSKPLMVKLSPNAPHLTDVALAVVAAGADALSLVNTFQATAINVETGSFVFDNVTAGLAGPAIMPIALRMVLDVCKAVRALPAEQRVPVVGLGGIRTWQDAVQFIMAGAAAVQVGTANFANPRCMTEIIDGIAAYMRRKGFAALSDFRGCALG